MVLIIRQIYGHSRKIHIIGWEGVWMFTFTIRWTQYFHWIENNCFNEKVLLRERKRHTDRGVSSTTEVGYPRPGPTGRGYLRWGTPCWGPGSRRGYLGVPPVRVPPVLAPGGYLGYPPVLAPGGTQGTPPLGYPPSWLWGVPQVPPSQGTPPSGYSPLGYSPVGYPPQLVYPPSWLGGYPGYPPSGYHPLGYPPIRVPPPPRCGQTEGQTRVKT